MATEDEGSGEDEAAQDKICDNAAVSMSPLSSALDEEQLVSRSDVNTEQSLQSTQSVDEDNKSSVSRSQDRSFSDDSRYGDGTPPTCKNGVMDLSRRGLSQLDRKYRKEYGCVKKLIIKCNRFNNVAGFDMFKQCVHVDASDNQLHKLSSFLPLAESLKVLCLSNNMINSIDCLRSFVNLETLDISCNYIESIPAALDNPRLSRLDLSSNAISSIPDLLKLRSLRRLNIASNRISSLKGAVFPKNLLSLNIASNSIEDLTEFMRLLPLEEIESISLANNPCVSNPSFDYRIYVLSVLPSLQDIDGFVVSEEEQLKGEWLYSQGKGRSFKPDTGAHAALVKYLERYCPFDVDGKLVSTLDQSVMKVMEKRREMLNHSGYDDDSSQSLSVHSPYGAWAAQLEGKENRVPSSSTDSSLNRRSVSARLPYSSTPGRNAPITSRPASQFEPLSRTSTMDSVDSSTTVTLVPAVQTKQEISKGTASTATTARVDRTARTSLQERALRLDDDMKQEPCQVEESRRATPKSGRRSKDPVESCRVSEVKSDRNTASRRSTRRSTIDHNKSRPSPAPVVTDISIDMGPSRSNPKDIHDEHSTLRRVMCLEDRVSTLTEENENLTRINDELSRLLVEMADKFSKDVSSLRSELESLKAAHHPEPCNLRVARELDNGCFEIIWDLPMVQCYKVLTNGVESGVVRAPNNAARISDVESGVEINVQLQAVHLDGSIGEPSKPLTIRTSPR
ncbi:Fibronectin type-III domain-containing protein [Trichostrongylus colubriformis]|uniref:Fibronectin type-III domain-containing protein n=1 Tax=Trichostrongylus colubriformis TaxID=6319 RepID=A0AAN8IDH5_TRICO